jgi:hypothetical protein
MSKKPSVDHDYRPKKDRLEITIKHYALAKKSDREGLIKYILRRLEKAPALAKATLKKAKKNPGRLPKSPVKGSRLVEVGD